MMKTTIPLCLAIATFATGCSLYGGAPYPAGRELIGLNTEMQTLKFYKIVGGEAPVERVGNRGFGDTCEDAGAALGKQMSEFKGTGDVLYRTMGVTTSNQQLNPELESFDGVPLSVIFGQTMSMGTSKTTTTSYGLDGSEDTASTTRGGIENTESEYFGLIGQQYLSAVRPLDIWTDLSWAVPQTDPYGGSLYGSPSDRPRLSLWTKRNPAVGEIWTSLDGMTLYTMTGTDVVTDGGGVDRPVNVVSVHSIQPVQPDGRAVAENCLVTKPWISPRLEFAAAGPGLNQGDTGDTADTSETAETADTSDPGSGDADERTELFLDASCFGAYSTQTVGTEWWWGDVLVKRDTTTYSVSVVDGGEGGYGYEWYTESGAGCSRNTSTLTPDDESLGAKPFIQYSVTETNNVYLLQSITQDGTAL